MADYCTLAELKAALSITDNIDDTILQTAITSASAWVDGWCYRSFEAAGTAVTDRDYIPTDTFETLAIDDCVEITEVKLDDDLDGTFADTLTAVDFQAEPVNATTGGLALPFTRLRPFEDGYWPTAATMTRYFTLSAIRTRMPAVMARRERYRRSPCRHWGGHAVAELQDPVLERRLEVGRPLAPR